MGEKTPKGRRGTTGSLSEKASEECGKMIGLTETKPETVTMTVKGTAGADQGIATESADPLILKWKDTAAKLRIPEVVTSTFQERTLQLAGTNV